MLTLKLHAVHDETPAIRVLQFCAADGAPLPDYTAGAHVEFDTGAPGTRAYSLIDWDDTRGEFYAVAVQREDTGGGGSKAMHALAVGDTISASAPKNDFELHAGTAPVLLLAGGIGITPMISMAARLDADGRAFALHFAARSADTMPFQTALRDAFTDRLHTHFDDSAPLNLTSLFQGVSTNTAVYICGPQGMIEAARTAAQDADIGDIHVELFATPQATADDDAFEVELSQSGEVFTIPPGQSIIDVLEEAGVDMMYDCQRGDCGICQTDVISGVPDHRDVVLSAEERAAGKVMQICVSRAKTPRLVLDL